MSSSTLVFINPCIHQLQSSSTPVFINSSLHQLLSWSINSSLHQLNLHQFIYFISPSLNQVVLSSSPSSSTPVLINSVTSPPVFISYVLHEFLSSSLTIFIISCLHMFSLHHLSSSTLPLINSTLFFINSCQQAGVDQCVQMDCHMLQLLTTPPPVARNWTQQHDLCLELLMT